jgi:hypothetical protein
MSRPSIIDQLGFPPAQLVSGRRSIRGLFKRKRRCGIYILSFATGEFYVGQARDVNRRYTQHRKVHPDIEAITVRWVRRDLLNTIEREVLQKLHDEGIALRNISLISIPRGESDFDQIMAMEEQQRWLDDLSFVSDEGERLQNDDLRRKYARSYQRLLSLPNNDLAINTLRAYVKVGIPAIKRGEALYWACTCLPSDSIYARVNINWQEVCYAYMQNGRLWFSLYMARSPLEAAKRSWWFLYLRYPGIQRTNLMHDPGGFDQVNYRVPAEAMPAFLRNEDVARAIRIFNLRLMKKGLCNYRRNHCLDLADRLIEAPDGIANR